MTGAIAGAIPAAAAVVLFAIALNLTGLIGAARAALAVAGGAAAALRDPGLDDLARERAARAAGLRLLALAGGVTLRAALTLAAAAAPLALADLAGLAPWAESVGVLARWEVILGATALVAAAHLALARRAR